MQTLLAGDALDNPYGVVPNKLSLLINSLSLDVFFASSTWLGFTKSLTLNFQCRVPALCLVQKVVLLCFIVVKLHVQARRELHIV